MLQLNETRLKRGDGSPASGNEAGEPSLCIMFVTFLKEFFH